MDLSLCWDQDALPVTLEEALALLPRAVSALGAVPHYMVHINISFSTVLGVFPAIILTCPLPSHLLRREKCFPVSGYEQQDGVCCWVLS